MTVPQTLPPAGWYPDPWGQSWWRWWDGAAWSGYTDQWYGAAAAAPAVDPDESVPIRAGWIAIGGAAVGVALSIGVYLALRVLGVGRESPWLLLGSACGLWSGLLGACRLAIRRHGSGSWRDLGLRFRPVDLALGLGFGVAAIFGVAQIARLLDFVGITPERESMMDPFPNTALTRVILVLVAVVGAPLVEELFFRGLLQSGFTARWGPRVGVVAQAVVFGLVHLGPVDARGNLGVFLIIAPLGIVLGAIRVGFRRLGPGIVTHAVYNAIIMAIVLSGFGT